MKLFGYISGANEVTAFQLYVELVQSKPNRRSHVQEYFYLKDEAKISMTVPVATKVTAEEEENEEGGPLMK